MNRFSAFLALAGMTSPSAAFMVSKLSATPTALNVQPQNEIPDDYVIPDGWVGGFAKTEKAFAYPQVEPDLNSLEVMDNMDNINKLDRMQKVLWPEFSWLSLPGDETSRVYQKFTDNVSRLGYTNDGRVYSIICPQQGFKLPFIGFGNIEVTVTGVRGWVEEEAKNVAAEMSVEGKIWLTPKPGLPLISALESIVGDKLPLTKDNAIVVDTYNRFEPWNDIFRVKNGTTTEYPIPQSRQHYDDNAYSVAHLYVEIGGVRKTGNPAMDDFHELIVKLINLTKGNKLKKGSCLSWNLWLSPPEIVDRDEWKNHADVWRKSIDVNHIYPDGENMFDEVEYFDGTTFHAKTVTYHIASVELSKFIEKHKKSALDDVKEHALDFIHDISLFHRRNPEAHK